MNEKGITRAGVINARFLVNWDGGKVDKKKWLQNHFDLRFFFRFLSRAIG